MLVDVKGGGYLLNQFPKLHGFLVSHRILFMCQSYTWLCDYLHDLTRRFSDVDLILCRQRDNTLLWRKNGTKSWDMIWWLFCAANGGLRVSSWWPVTLSCANIYGNNYNDEGNGKKSELCHHFPPMRDCTTKNMSLATQNCVSIPLPALIRHLL